LSLERVWRSAPGPSGMRSSSPATDGRALR
jgi:hypothetical protein